MTAETPTPEITNRVKKINALLEQCIFATPGAIEIILDQIKQLESGQSTPDTLDTDHSFPPHES